MKKAQNDVDFIPSIMNRTISDAQKYSSLFGCHQQFMLNNLGRRRTLLGFRQKLEEGKFHSPASLLRASLTSGIHELSCPNFAEPYH